MNILLIRFLQRQGASGIIPWHYLFFKDILEAKGHRVTILDNQIHGYSLEQMLEMVRSQAIDVVGTGGIGTVYSPLAAFCRGLKRELPAVKLVVGGHIVADHDFLLRDLPIDVVVKGEGEITLLRLVEAWAGGADWKGIPGIAYLDGPDVVVNPKEEYVDLNTLPEVSFKDIDLDAYKQQVSAHFIVDDTSAALHKISDKHIAFYLARGCPYNCFFCYRHMPGYRCYNRENIEKILTCFKENGFSFLSYGDECITANKQNLRNVCELSKKLDIYWNTSGRVDHVNDEVLKMLAEGNCVGLQYGVESFDETMLDRMNKKTSPAQNIEAINKSYQWGMFTVLQLVIGAPGENRQSLFNTRKGMWSCHFPADKIAVAVMNPYPGSGAYWYCLEKGLITDKKAAHEEFSDKATLVVNMSELSDRELKAWMALLHVEAAASFRVKHRMWLLNASLLSRVLHLGRTWAELLAEPANFLGFTASVLKGASYWFKPLPRLRWAERNPARTARQPF